MSNYLWSSKIYSKLLRQRLFDYRWVLGNFLCKMYQFVHSLSYTASIFILIVICTERYFAIIHPITCKQILTPTRLRVSQISRQILHSLSNIIENLTFILKNPTFFLYLHIYFVQIRYLSLSGHCISKLDWSILLTIIKS